jgi:hypothetical protein
MADGKTTTDHVAPSAEDDEIVFTDVNTISVAGGVDVTIERDGTLRFRHDIGVATCDGPVLTLGGEDSGANSIFCNGVRTDLSGDNVCVRVGSGHDGVVTVNGVIVRPTSPPSAPPRYRLDASCTLAFIALSGAACVRAIPDKFISARRLSVDVCGAACLDLGESGGYLPDLKVNVRGAGTVHGNGVRVDHAELRVRGVGTVDGIVITQSGSVEVVGAGSIKVHAEDPTHVSHRLRGAGTISLRPVGDVE